MNSLESVSTQRLYRLIADQIAAKIAVGDFAPGTRLPSERELADKLEVSRSSIREALIALEIDGYVEIRVGSGVFVAKPGADEQITTMRVLYQALANSDTPSQHDRAFHAAIAQACGNAALEAVMAHVWDLSDASVVFGRLDEHMVTSDVWQLALVEHARVLAAIEEHDPVRARHEMHGHLIGVLSRLRKDFVSADMAEPVISKRPTARESTPHLSSKMAAPQGKTVRSRRTFSQC